MRHPIERTSEKMKKFRINVINAFLLFILAVSGFVLISAHGGRHSAESLFLGADKGLWRTIHIITAFSYLPFFSYHLFYQRKWLKFQFSKMFNMVRGRQLVSRLIIAVSALTLFTGFVGYLFNELGSHHAGFGFVEIHDKMGILLTIFLIIHIRYNVVVPHRRVLAKEVE